MKFCTTRFGWLMISYNLYRIIPHFLHVSCFFLLFISKILPLKPAQIFTPNFAFIVFRIFQGNWSWEIFIERIVLIHFARQKSSAGMLVRYLSPWKCQQEISQPGIESSSITFQRVLNRKIVSALCAAYSTNSSIQLLGFVGTSDPRSQIS